MKKVKKIQQILKEAAPEVIIQKKSVGTVNVYT